MEFFYMEKDFYAGQFTKRAIPKGFTLNFYTATFLTSILNTRKEYFKGFLVRYFEEKFAQEVVYLPTKNGKPDFDFMESFITELEALRITELKDYLSAAGLQNYELSEEEERALKSLNSTVQWNEYRIGDLFEKVSTKKLPYKADELPKQPKKEYVLPCLTSSFQNQGLNYYVPRESATILKNVISIPSNSDIYRAYYQSNEFTVLSDAYAISWIDKNILFSPNQYLFAVMCINKVTDLPIYSYKNKLGGWNVVQNKKIQLPTKNGHPDFELIEQLVSALKKLIIKDVVLYTERKVSPAMVAVANNTANA